MSRSKKTRRLKGKQSIKTGSKKDFIKPGEKGKIPSKNRLKKHKERPKSAYQKHQLKDESSGQPQKPPQTPETQDDAQLNEPTAQEKSFDELDGSELMDMFNKSNHH
jgi:hypothetical protein